MKIDDRRLFTYPVLAAGRDDYKTCKYNGFIQKSARNPPPRGEMNRYRNLYSI